MIVLDTTVLVYAVGDEHPLRGPCRALVAAVAAGSVAATTTVEVVQEFTHVRSRRRDRKDAAALAASWVDLLAPLRSPDGDDLRAGLDLFRRTERLGAFDCVLAATAMRLEAGLVSADGGFGSVRGLVHHDPAAATFGRLLQGGP